MRILLAEDERACRRMLEATLIKWGYDVVVARDGDEAWQVLQQEDAPKFALLDWMMPGMDGPEVCQKVRERATEPYVYMILLTAKNQKEEIVQGMEAGADDYVTKPFDADELRARLRVGKRILELQEQLVSMREAFQVQATHDPLTGLWNRAAILDLLQRELDRASREGTPVGVILADLDHFKRINDTFGHLAGDAVLRETAQRMNAAMRGYDAVGRYGGEEFLIVVPGCNADNVLRAAERVRECISREPIHTADGLIGPVTLSLGVAASADVTEEDEDSLLRAADMALYRAKDEGRNRAAMAAGIDGLEYSRSQEKGAVPAIPGRNTGTG